MFQGGKFSLDYKSISIIYMEVNKIEAVGSTCTLQFGNFNTTPQCTRASFISAYGLIILKTCEIHSDGYHNFFREPETTLVVQIVCKPYFAARDIDFTIHIHG